MTVVIVGGNRCMTGRYRDICGEYDYDAKVFTEPQRNLERLIGKPDLIILFTNPVAHGMAGIAKKKAAKCSVELVQSHCGSCDSLKNILNCRACEARRGKNAAATGCLSGLAT